jgi:Mg2+/Co2+ transporter CorB
MEIAESLIPYYMGAIFFLMFLSAFFSGSETGLTAVSRAKIHKLEMEGDKKAKMVSNLRKKKDQLISVILLGNNIVNIAGSALATALAIHYYGEEGVLYATLVMTLLILIFAEVLPKSYAFQNAEKVALAVAPIFSFLVKVLSPITRLIGVLVNAAMWLFRIRQGEGDMAGAEILRGAIELQHMEGTVVKEDRDMLGSILDLGDTEVEDIMVHRRNMMTLDVDLDKKQFINSVLDSQFTRLPVWEETQDNIIGVLHAKELLRAMNAIEDTNALDIKSILMDPWFVPSSTTLRDQLQAFRERKNHFSLVVDEYGELLGLVTLEDILEEIVGQIDDEHDTENSSGIIKKEEGVNTYVIEGATTIRDINRELDWNLPDEEASTLAGLIIHEAQRIPNKGQVFQFFDCRFQILKKVNQQIVSIKVTRMVEDDEEEAS